jgi:hypothetical protein
MLMIALVRELSKEIPGELSPTIFFFCQATDPRLNSASSILRGLIWKLAMNRPHVARIFLNKYESNNQFLNGLNIIYALFSTLLAILEGYYRTFLLIDALDECNSRPERDILLKLITNYTKSLRAKWLLASRNYPDIKQLLEIESWILSLELNE